MNYNYSDSLYLQKSLNSKESLKPTRVSSPIRQVQYEDQYDQRETTNYSEQKYMAPIEEVSSYYVRLQNDELTKSLFQERRVNRELSSQLDLKYKEIEIANNKLNFKTEEVESIKNRFEQSEKLKLDQEKFIKVLQKNIDSLRERILEKEIGDDDKSSLTTDIKGKKTEKSKKSIPEVKSASRKP